MTDQIRQRIVSTISNWINKNGNMPLSNLKGVLREAQIPSDIVDKISPKAWISNQFPEFMIVGTNGHEHVVIADKIVRILLNAMAKEGKFLLSNVSPTLSAEGVAWKEHANGKKLHEWIQDSYGGLFQVSEDKRWLYVADSESISQAVTPIVMPDQITRSFVYQFCYCPVNAVLLKQVKELTGDESMIQIQWITKRTFALAHSLIGLNGGMLDDSQSETPRMAFHTGLKTPLGQDIYGILSQNANEGAIQGWTLSAVAFPGQDTEEGQWLCDAFGLNSQRAYGENRTKIMQAVTAALNEVQQAQSVLVSECSLMQRTIEEGCVIPESISKAITSYISGWGNLRKALESAGEDFTEESLNLNSVQQLLNDWNDTKRVQEELEQKFEQLAQAAWIFLEDNMLCPKNLSAGDISLWKELVQQHIDAEITAHLRKQMEPFQALGVLRAFNHMTRGALDDAEYAAIEAVNGHFGARLKPAQLKHSICNQSIDMSFLGLVPEIYTLIRQVESRNKKQQLQNLPIDDNALLDAAIDGSLWNIANNAFTRPNPLEEAAMLGDMDAVYEFVKNEDAMHALGYGAEYEKLLLENSRKLQFSSTITPVHAAKRLEELLGSSCAIIEQCLLLGVMQREEGAAESLIQHYIDTDRSQLASILFRESAEKMPTETRRQLMLTLGSSGNISVEEMIQMDIPTLLTDEGISVVESIEPDAAVRERLTCLHDKIRPTLVHHIVFLSPELQSYILRPENSSELGKYPLDLSENGISNLLRQNAYARGNAPLQVAKRINEFIGNWNDLAQQFALLSPNTPDRQAFLFDLYSAQDDDGNMLQFLGENPNLKEEHFSYYIELLFRNQKYGELYDAVSENGDSSVRERMQMLVSSMRLGRKPAMLPEFEVIQAVENTDILLELGLELARTQKEQHRELLLRVFPIALTHLDEEQLKQLVTANGELDDDDLCAIAEAAVDACPSLTIYCGNILNTDAFEPVRDAYFKKRYDMLGALDPEARSNLVRELRILNSEKYVVLMEELLKVQLTELLEKEDTLAAKAQNISNLLKGNTISSGAFLKLLEQLDDQDIIFYAPLYRQLFAMAQNNDDLVRCLRSVHRCREQGDDELRLFLCEQYMDLDEQGLLPEDLITECESLLLEKLGSLPRTRAQQCIVHIEQQIGRAPYASFAQYMIDHDRSEIEGNEISFLDETASTELALLCDVLEERSDEIEEYLGFCAAFMRTADRIVAGSVENEDTNIAHIMHALYQHPTDANLWNAMEKLIPQERIQARAYALFFGAVYQGKARTEDSWKVENVNDDWKIGKANRAWERCVVYCMAENQDLLFFRAIQNWLQDIDNYYVQRLPWYATKPFMSTMQKILESSDLILQTEKSQMTDFPSCSAEMATVLVTETINIFKRINQDKENRINVDENHNSLRVILELGIQLGCEELLLERLSEELIGSYVNLGLVLICRLLLAGKLAVIMPFLRHFANASIKEYNYVPLVKQLAAMDSEDELRAWLSSEEHRATLRFILPNGNVPNIFRLQSLVMTSYSGDDELRDVCASVVENLLDCYPEDVMCYKSLFIICKENYSSNLIRIHRALVGLFKFYGRGERKQFTRSQDVIMKLIVILRHTMEAMGYSGFEAESTTELVRGYYGIERNALDEKVSELNRLADEVKSLFVGIDNDTQNFTLLINSLLGSVTGNWMPFIRDAFRGRVTDWVRTYRVDRYCAWGQLRGILRVWHDLSSEEERKEFRQWVQSEVKQDKDNSIFYKHVARHLNYIFTKIDVDSVNWSILRLPWEEHLVCIGNLKDINRPERNCCYKIMMAERLKGQSARDSFILMIRLAQDILKAQLLDGNAKEWFRKGDYALAGDAYEALAISKIVPRLLTKDELAAYNENYETWMRISRIFAGVDISMKRCSEHSCMNVMTALVNEGYAKYFDRLRGSFKENNLKLFLAVRKIFSSDISEEDMLNMTSEFRREKERPALIAFLHFLLSKDKNGSYLFLTDQSKIDSATMRLRRQEETRSADERGKYWIPLQVRPLVTLFPAIDDQDTDSETDETIVYKLVNLNESDSVPYFISEAEKFCQDENSEDSVQDLMNEYNRLTTYLDGDYSQRLRLSARIYFLCMNDDMESGKEQAIVRFGINYYYYYRNRISKSENPEQERNRIHRTMLDLAAYGLKTPAISSEVVQFLPNWFQYSIRGFSSIDSLLEDYSYNLRGYTAIARLLSDTEYSDVANGMLEVLNSLLAAADRLGTKTVDIRSYQAAQFRLSDVTSTRDWSEMLLALNGMFQQAINKLDQRPSLKVTIFNEDKGLQNDGLYGEIENTGRDTASKLELQATFPQNESQLVSALYRLPILRPNEKAAFAISYRSQEGMTELEYILNLSYNDKELRLSVEPLHGILTLSPNMEAPAIIPRFDTQQASAFTVNEEGEIVSQDFKGRKSEINSLVNLLTGEGFSKYRSAIVQGIKRSGKTSLLNYLRTFIRFKKEDDTIQLFVDCQRITKPYIYKAFFKSVLDELPLEYPQVVSQPGWPDFVSQWRLQEGERDREPEDLSLFFRQLHRMMDGKGLYLIVDEFDVLLDRLDEEKGFDFLLQALRSLQMNPDCFNAVHMVLCGSNHLLVYNQTGSTFNQMFQSYELIPVGQMLTSDIQEMILDLMNRYPFIHFAERKDNEISPSIQWIERYTGGLVWHTRLLVNEAIRAVLADNRDCIYPSDVCAAFNTICNYNNCRQLTDGCDENDKLVLDAMQCLSERFRSYVSVEQLMQLLGNQMSAEQLRKSLSTLVNSVELLEQKAPDIKSYRFRIELYRRYFRTTDSKFSDQIKSGNRAGGDCFTIAEVESNIETVDSNSEFD